MGTHITASLPALTVFIKSLIFLTGVAAFALASVVIKVRVFMTVIRLGLWAHCLTCTSDIVESVPGWAGFLLALTAALVCIPLVPMFALLVLTLTLTSVWVPHFWTDTGGFWAHTSAGLWVYNLVVIALQVAWALTST